MQTAALATIATLIGEPARAAMLSVLMDGKALTAGELAAAAGIAPQTASGHLARLTEAGLLAMTPQGRHRYHRLAGPEVAAMLETLVAVATVKRPVTGPRHAAMRAGRTCYDHLAGRLGVAIADSLVAQNHVELGHDGAALTPSGEAFLAGLGIPLPRVRTGRVFCRPCLDWSERRPHLAGAVGTAWCRHCFSAGWVRRIDATRAVGITPAGHQAFRLLFGWAQPPGSSGPA